MWQVAHFECDVSDKQHSELIELVWAINKNGSKAIDKLRSEGEKVLGVNSPLHDVWHQDVERLEYEKDQRKMGMLTTLSECLFFRCFTCTVGGIKTVMFPFCLNGNRNDFHVLGNGECINET